MSRLDGVATEALANGRRRVLDTVTALPAWAAVLLVWTGGRILSTFWLALAYPLIGRALPDNAIWGNEHGFLSFLTAWDGQYYEQISLHGYPDALPLDITGNVAQNAWAFLPAFPFTIRMLTASTGVPFEVGAPLIAVLAGLLAAYLLHRLVRDRAGDAAAMWAVFFFTCGPLSFLLQVGYAESMFLALSFGALLALERRRYWLLTLLGVVAAFTRPGALAIPLVLGVVALVRFVRARRSNGRVFEAFPLREQLRVVVAGLVMMAAGLAWPVIASHVTGTPNAYLETEMSWWVNFIGRVDFMPLSPWFLIAARWLGVGGVLIVVFLLVGYPVWLLRRSTRRLGQTTVLYSAAYALYIFAVSLPMASTPRLLMPLAPLFGSPELVAKPWMRWTFVTAALAGQPVLVAVLWLLGPP
ncbi:mannosyltransferase family protein [Curtobacterium sp. PhB115]|uniref:mannosyltransferase family protein n=1 Tax=Curtobacterium sp. PhB115 TaxID=2485173 RepID=UPI000F4C9E6D|nr:mannosyltransferase family protein [Curtobacterium sp. PhB115]ROP65485.1 mannosyltransferase PIG-V [Curtobacterium sp. PhB115]